MDFDRTIFLNRDSVSSNSLNSFNCGDKDLNEFLKKDALEYEKNLLAKTYLLITKKSKKIIAFYSMLNDKVSLIQTRSKNSFNQQVKSELSHYKNHFKRNSFCKNWKTSCRFKFSKERVCSVYD